MSERGIVQDDGAIVFEEFEEGDPRRGPHFLDTRIEAETQARAPRRWHLQKRHVDWFAIRLTVGRGYTMQEAGRRFGVSDSHISKRADTEDWVIPMAESDRRELSVLVWLAGVVRLPTGDENSRNALKAASEWRPKQTETYPVWREKNRLGEPRKFTINDEIPDDAYFSDADLKRDERRSVVDELDAKLGELESQLRGRLQSRRSEPDNPVREAETLADVGAVAGGVDRPIEGAASMASVGPPEPASS